ncbi:hypothetical protein ASPCADRAFT_161938 [Aspergillus carbonarius ITEM 5010]|uniref:Cysteine protease n=1 Tax=Aspergillus carbonarius (strain ITEM 5010) TaxID=602072 RepID=A0A1R3RVF7_ASPC5|nr:hypothetical protein ASPCADRAFT_139540 [Aspergillus carbonarius ITEM 5010]OOF98488.1 hypothetical protein ASPCADRAFT_161938 [Aspergillus carbonarius ITEM 5010]
MNSVDIGRCSKRIVQYLWDPEPKNDEDPKASIWCLGVEYPPYQDNPRKTKTLDNSDPWQNGQTARTRTTTDHAWPESFLLDFESKIWMTYRSNFPPIPKLECGDMTASMTLGVRLRSHLVDTQGFTSDTGWGCMIRSGQSLLANAMSILLLGRGWRRGENLEEEAQLLSLFADVPSAPFSIHRFVTHGAESCGKYPGEWFGPSATAKCIDRALSSQCEHPMLRVYVTNDTSEVYQDKFMSVARNNSGVFQPTLILLGTRLGINHITPVYWDGLKAALQFPQSVGIAGGRPSASHYFVGAQGSHLFYLDPHYTRPAFPDREQGVSYSKEEVDTYHTRRLRRIHLKDMDPSMLIGFLIRNQEDWYDWINRLQAVDGRPIIHVLNKMNTDHRQEAEALDQVEVLDDSE